jgi:dihydroorotase
MPNTDPVNDHPGITELILKKAADANLARVYPIGAVSMASKGEQMSELGAQKAAGCVAFTDDGRPVASALLMRRALEYAGMLGMPIVDHCEDPSLKGDGVAHEGFHAGAARAARHPGRRRVDHGRARHRAGRADRRAVSRLPHERAAVAARGARRQARGVTNVTCEVAPHHFVLTDEALETADPLRHQRQDEPAAARDGGSRRDARRDRRRHRSDVIATDHAPHHADEKLVEFDRAPFGIVGLETCVPLVFDRLVHAGRIGVPRAIELLSANPARVFRCPAARSRRGAGRHHDPRAGRAGHDSRRGAAIEIEEHAVRRLAAARGRRATIVGGRIVYRNEVMDRKTGIAAAGAAAARAVRSADAQRALRLRQRLPRPRLSQRAPVVPAAVDDLALAQDLLDVLPGDLLEKTESSPGR